MTRVAVSGASGRMGRALLEVIHRDPSRWVLAGTLDSARSEVRYLPDDCEVLIEFSTPRATLEHLRSAVERRLPMVIGTTGFSHDEQAVLMALAPRIPCVWAPNMSLGVAVLSGLVEHACRWLKDFDVEIIETHHRLKADAPSGTAKILLEAGERGDRTPQLRS